MLELFREHHTLWFRVHDPELSVFRFWALYLPLVFLDVFGIECDIGIIQVMSPEPVTLHC